MTRPGVTDSSRPKKPVAEVKETESFADTVVDTIKSPWPGEMLMTTDCHRVD